MATYGEMYRDMLDELYDLGHFSPSAAIEALDPHAFGEGFVGFVDDGTRFTCWACGDALGKEDAWGTDEDDSPMCKRCSDTEDMDEDEIAAYDREHAVEA